MFQALCINVWLINKWPEVEGWITELLLHTHTVQLFEWSCREFEVRNLCGISFLGNLVKIGSQQYLKKWTTLAFLQSPRSADLKSRYLPEFAPPDYYLFLKMRSSIVSGDDVIVAGPFSRGPRLPTNNKSVCFGTAALSI